MVTVAHHLPLVASVALNKFLENNWLIQRYENTVFSGGLCDPLINLNRPPQVNNRWFRGGAVTIVRKGDVFFLFTFYIASIHEVVYYTAGRAAPSSSVGGVSWQHPLLLPSARLKAPVRQLLHREKDMLFPALSSTLHFAPRTL